MITLGGLQLSDNLLLKGLRGEPVAVDMQRSDEGVALVLVAPIEGGRLLTLDGYFTAAQVDSLMDMARLRKPVTLVHPRGTISVLITGSSLEDWIEYVEPDPDDYEVGTINLIEV